MSDKPVIVIDNVNAQLLTEQIAHLKIISAKEQNNLVRVESNPLAPNAATEITLKAILEKLSNVLSVDCSGKVLDVSVKDIPLAKNAATDSVQKEILEQLQKTIVVKPESKVPVFGEISVTNFPEMPKSVEISNFPTETVVRVNNTILAPNAASESTLKSISDKILDKVEVKGMIDVKSSVLPSNAASESTLNEIKAILAELLSVEKNEDKKPQYVSVEQAEIGVSVQQVKMVSFQVISGEFNVFGSNDNENYHQVNSFNSEGFHTIQPYFRYLKISKSKDAVACIVLLFN